MFELTRRKINSKNGMTMAEMLTVVAIIIILAGVAFIAIMSYQRSLEQTERDTIAKELFIVAQNHLTASRGELYTKLNSDEASDVGTEDPEYAIEDTNAGDKTARYIVYSNGTVSPSGCEVILFNNILPTGSIDDTVRKGGCYIIRYQPKIAKILDVFYWDSTPERFNYTYSNGSYAALSEVAGTEKAKRDARRSFGTEKSVIGWYGGEGLESLGEEIQPPTLEVENAAKLRAIVTWGTNEYVEDDGVVVRLIIKGKISKAEKALPISPDAEIVITNDMEPAEAEFILDDITMKNSGEDEHFATLFKASDNDQKKFIPGEDLEIQAISFSKKKLSNIAVSNIKVENSLFYRVTSEADNSSLAAGKATYSFDDGVLIPGKVERTDKVLNTAYIKSIRHLENLDKNVSNLDENDSNKKLQINSAIQVADLDWNTFKEKTEGGDVSYSVNTGANYSPTPSTFNCYKPIDPNPTPEAEFSYDGRSNAIKNIEVKTNTTGETGLFGKIEKCDIKNMQLINFDIHSKDSSAGALAGCLTDSTVENVVVKNKDDGNTKLNTSIDKVAVHALTKAGGLVGEMSSGSKIEYCAAAVQVEGATAGGLVGTASGSNIKGSYASGRTDRGEYYTHNNDGEHDKFIVNIDGTDIAGGFIGEATGTTITNCYSTASVYAANGTAGGFVGSATEERGLSNCYCTGLVNGKTAYAFVGSGGVGTDNKYFAIVNELEADKNGVMQYMDPASGDSGIEAFDEETSTYKAYVNGLCDAEVYDPVLAKRYINKDGKTTYVLKPINKLDTALSDTQYKNYFVQTHYGDWPSPETFVVNIN